MKLVGFIQGEGLLDQLGDYQLLKENSASQSYLRYSSRDTTV